jgi:hypothetical protein
VLGEGKPGSEMAQSLASAVAGIGAALSAAGVTFGGGISNAASGVLALDNKLPAMVASTQAVEGGRQRT